MEVGFTVIQQAGQARFELTPPEDQGRPALISFARTDAAAAVLMGRLYYRHELLGTLRSRLPEDSLREYAASEAALALCIYREFGLDGLEGLEGDFAFALWDSGTSRLIGMRDPMGGYPLYWKERGDAFALGTGVEPLLIFQGERTLSREYLADFLMMSGPREEGATELCVYEGIHRVLPGTVVLLDARTRAVRKRVYWNWRERIEDPGTDRLEEVTGQYLDALRTAVRERLRGRTSAQLSGGMDSTSVALLARELIGAGAAEGPLHILSLVYERLPQLARERPYIEKGLQGKEDAVAHRIPADDLLHYDAFANAPPLDEPYPGLWALQMDLPMVAATAEAGAATMLTGHGADEIHDVQPYFLADLLRRGRFFRAWAEAGHWARARNGNRWEVLKTFGLAGLGWRWLSGGLWRNPAGLNAQDEYTVPPWVVPSFAHDYQLRQRAMDNYRKTYRQGPNTTLSVTLSGLTNRAGDVLRWSVAAPLGIVIAHPFLDRRLLALGLGIQMRLRPEPGRKKPVLAEAMGGILPDEIAGRRAKGCFDEVYYLGLARNLPYLEAMVQNAPLGALGMFDKNILIPQIEEASLGGAKANQLHRLDITLSLIKWLGMQEEGRRAPRPPAEVIWMRLPAGAENGLPLPAPSPGERVRPEPFGPLAGSMH